ncbi:hypothetical protein AVO42_00735 [Thiomicrospira sp. XS5]|uniref:methyl-accepting chemotaxis protein n=1 Tax=Thiomicrospira sp. XS5 TaxID=1775636 RepID=UPI0007497661|nr:methyl-accepting chemotaxis protein [Thiomicrospira sp. XS5]KUJ73979.1 hypothetical protein AVO42_00735 [Thiomicrospira sp. XS5]
MFDFSRSLKAKVIGISTLVGIIIAFLVGLTMYLTTVKPVPAQVEKRIFKEMTAYIDAQVDLKVKGGIIGATMITLQNSIIQSLAVEDRDALKPFFANIKAGFARKTGFKNIATQLITYDGRSLIRSWDLENYGQNVSNNPLIQKVMKEKKAYGALGVGARGIGVIAVSPIFEDDSVLGYTTLVQGMASVAKDFRANEGGEWVLLVDKRYIDQKYGNMPIIEKNETITDNYLLASNRWFDADAVSLVKASYQPTDGMARHLYTTQGKVVIDIPAIDESGDVMGRHLFILPETEYTGPINTAMNNAWMSLAGVILGVLVLTIALIITVTRMVINPLKRVQKVTGQIIESGDFALRAPVNSQDEVGRTGDAINQLLEQVSQALTQANQTVGAIAKGDFSKRLNGDYKGDLETLQTGINESVDIIDQVMNELSGVMQAMRDGRFDVSLSNQGEGEYRKMMDNAQQAMSETNSIITEINAVMEHMRQGEFQHRVQVSASGDLDSLKQRINESLSTLDEAVSDITRVVVAQSEGDLTQTIDAEYQGDLMRLKNAVNQSLQKLSDIVSQSIITSQVVNTASEEVAKGALDLSSRVQEQAAAIEQTSATMDEMNSAVQNNTDNSQQAASVAQKVQTESEQASKVMQQTITAMNTIQESSHKISEIVTLIDSIAFQTNLLALNAAVEAARAGDHGRGFAVVAGEVRALAQKSADAAKEINSLITESVQRIDEGTHLAGESGEVIGNITQMINEMSLMINQIAQASTEQAQGVEQVHKAIGEIDATTQQNAALVEETSAAAESMSEQATDLSHNMAFFKTNTAGQPKVNKPAALSAPKPTLEAPKSAAPKTEAPAKPAQAEKPADKPTETAKSITPPPPPSADEWEDF